MFVHKGCVGEEVLSEGGLHTPYGFPVGGDEVSTEYKAYLEEYVLGKDVRDYARNLWMMFDLAEA